MGRPLPWKWYIQDPEKAARRLLGKILVRKIGETILECMITETEAYYGPEDPASRARKGGDLKQVMKGPVGHALVYGIHRQWLLNVVAHPPGEYGAVLIRSCQPLKGVETMMVNRRVQDPLKLTTGPGRLTRALAIDKFFHRKPLYTTKHGLWIEEGHTRPGEKDILTSHRIGVTEDLDRPLRFLLASNKYVSKPGRV